MSLRTAAARILARWRRRPTLEDRLLAGETIELSFAPNVTIAVNLHDGLTTTYTRTEPTPDSEARRLLYAARAAQWAPDAPRRRQRGAIEATPDPDNPAMLTIPVSPTRKQNAHFGDVLAAYLRLIDEEYHRV